MQVLLAPLVDDCATLATPNFFDCRVSVLERRILPRRVDSAVEGLLCFEDAILVDLRYPLKVSLKVA